MSDQPSHHAPTSLAAHRCPRVIGSNDGRLVTCGETIPCTSHEMPLFVMANPTHDTTGGDQE